MHPLPESTLQALYEVLHDSRSLVHRLKWAAAQLHQQGELSAGKRGVLMSLESLGPQTVPELARARPVSRQHIQMLVNPLVEEGLVELVQNPNHRRSKRVQLTPRGRRRIQAMRQREHAVFQNLDLPVTETALVETAATLAALRQLFEGEAWERALKQRVRRSHRTEASR